MSSRVDQMAVSQAAQGDGEDIPTAGAAPSHRGVVRTIVWGAFTGLAGALLIEACHIELAGNFHAIIPGRVYRCAQPSPQQLEKMIREQHIRTVINLRGNSVPMPWYFDECRVTSQYGVAQEDVCFSAGRMPSVHEIRRLLDVLDHCEYPVLFHCQRGADRTGLAASVLFLTRTDADLATARRQLGPRYGHAAFGKTAQLDRFLDLYEDWLHRHDMQHTQANFRHWVAAEYQEYAAALQLLEQPAMVRAAEPSLFEVRARNISPRQWKFQTGRTAGTHAYYLIHNERNQLVYQGRAGLFDMVVEPGETIDLKLTVPALRNPGTYRLWVDLADEQHCLFYQIGSEPLEVEFQVRD